MPSFFSLARRKPRPTVTETQSTASLPNLDPSEPGLGSWPESLIDPTTLGSPPDDAEFGSAQTTPTKAGATKSAFAIQGNTISFHRPFRGPPPSSFQSGINGSISVPLTLSLDKTRSVSDQGPAVPSTPTHKRPRAPVQTFNLLVAGARGSGKTSLLNLLLLTSRVPPGVGAPQKLKEQPTQEITEQSLEVQQGLRRYMLSVVDTPGLEITPGRELEFDRAVQDLVRYQEKRMGEALVMESKVVREMVADKLVHLTPLSEVKMDSDRTKGAYTSSTPLLSIPRPSSNDSNIPSSEAVLHMHPSDILAIRRLSARYHVLPLISKADTLTDRQLGRIKQAVKRDVGDLAEQGRAAWGIFDFHGAEEEPHANGHGTENGNGNGNSKRHSHVTMASVAASTTYDDSSSEEDEQPKDGKTTPKPRHRVIHIRPTSALRKVPKLRRARSLSRARPSADSSDSDTPTMSTPADQKRELGGLLPWGIVAPEEEEEDENKEGKRWVRRFRWGVIDVMNKEHCDFWALRQAVLVVYFKVLRNDTRRVLYEKFRTEKLLARRATRAMTEDERKKIYGL